MGDCDQNPPNKVNENSYNQEDLYICSYNVKTLLTSDKLTQLQYALQNVKWDIIGVSEVRKNGYCIEELDWCVFCYTRTTKGQKGVGFLINKKHKDRISEFIEISDRIAILNMNFDSDILTIIQVYAPTSTAKEEEIENFYTDLRRARGKCHNNVIIIGDFNAKIGIPALNKQCSKLIGPYGSGEQNERGDKLIQFALEQELKNINHRWTWISPDGKTKNEIDYILTNIQCRAKNFEVINKVKYPSDHRLIQGTFCLTMNKKKGRKKYQYQKQP